MKKTIKLAIIAAFAVTGVFTALVHSAPEAIGPSEAASPRSLYMQNCARCHGSDGKAQTALGKKLEADDLTTSNANTEKIVRTVTNGRGDMPSFRKKLSKAQIASIAGYVKSL